MSGFQGGRMFGAALVFLLVLPACTPKNKGEPKLLSLLGADDQTTEASEGGVEKNYDALTLLRRGEKFYDKEDYLEAVGEYQRFLELHPFHRLSPYVQYKVGMAYYHQIDALDRDQEPAEKSLAAFEKLETDFPRNLFAEQAKAKITEVKNRLAERQLYIGKFYYKKGAYPAAIARFQKVVAQGNSVAIKGEALYYEALSHLDQGRKEEAARLLQELLDLGPQAPFRGEASRLLGHIRKAVPS